MIQLPSDEFPTVDKSLTMKVSSSESSQGVNSAKPNGNDEDGLINQQQNLNCNVPVPVHDAQLPPVTINTESNAEGIYY